MCSVAVKAQTSNISVVSAEKLNVVYRGLDNPVRIMIPGVDPAKITVLGEGVKKVDEKGNYLVKPGIEKEVRVKLSFRNSQNTLVTEERIYVVEPFPMLEVSINNEYHPDNNYILNREQLLNLDVNVIIVPECPLFEKPTTAGFTIFIPGYKHITCPGSKLNDEAIKIIKSLKIRNQIIVISNVAPNTIKDYPILPRKKVSPVVIKLRN